MQDQKEHFRFDYIRLHRSYFTFSISEKVRNTVRTKRKLREVYGESVKTDFQ